MVSTKLPPMPPAVLYLDSYDFQQATYRLQAQFHEATVTPSRDTKEWSFATRLMQSLFKVSDNLWDVISSPSARPVLSVAVRQWWDSFDQKEIEAMGFKGLIVTKLWRELDRRDQALARAKYLELH